MKYRLALLGCLLPALAFAQGGPIIQSGNLTPGHALMGITNGVAGDAGPALGGSLKELGITAPGTPFCIDDAPIASPYHQLCLGANSLGGGLITYGNFGSAAPLPLRICTNGTCTDFPFSTSGIVGPSVTVVGNVPEFGNTVGTLLRASPTTDDGTLMATIERTLVTPASNVLLANTYLGSFQNKIGGLSAQTIYGGGGPMCPGCVVSDTLQSVSLIPTGTPSSLTAVNGVGSYIESDVGTTNAVSFFGAQTIKNDNATVWGLNTICQDTTGSSGSTGTGVGRNCVGAEFDFNPTQTGTSVTGVALLGSPSVSIQPLSLQGFVVGSMQGIPNPTVKWNYSFVSTGGVANVALIVGSMSGVSVHGGASQPIVFGYWDSGGVGQQYTMSVSAAGSIGVTNSAGANTALFSADTIVANNELNGYLLGTDQVIAGSSHAVTFGSGGSLTNVNIGNSVAPVGLIGVVHMPLVTTGTPAASLCLDASSNIIKKTTPGSCI